MGGLRVEGRLVMARILLADDEQATRDLVRHALVAEGHTVEAMTGGAEALERLLAGPGDFDLLVTDVQMPTLDGISLAEQALSANRDLRLILMSGFLEQLARTHNLDASRVTTLSKPFTLDQLKQATRRALA
jgi:CheY-like chemotaxis protein